MRRKRYADLFRRNVMWRMRTVFTWLNNYRLQALWFRRGWEFLDQLGEYQFLEDDCTAWTYFLEKFKSTEFFLATYENSTFILY
jgi:hypothetical protein